MIVFYYVVSFILITVLIMAVLIIFSSITVDIVRFSIDDIDKLGMAIDAGVKKNYDCMTENLGILIKIKINLFSIIPITLLRINNRKLRKLLKKTNKKSKPNIYKKEKYKFIIKKILDKYLKINNININISLGVYNAYLTAISSGLLMIALSIAMQYITEDRIKKFKDEKKQDEYIEKQFIYQVNPIYKDDLILSVGLNAKFTIQILSILKENLMYKFNLFVNNTNKYKVKES